MLGHLAPYQVVAISPNSHLIHTMKKRKIGEGISDHTDERGQVFPSELCAEIPAALLPRDHQWEQQCLRAASSNRKPSELLSCLPMGALTHPSHLRIKGFLAKLHTSGGTGQRKQIRRKKATGRLPVLRGCHHRSSIPPHQLVAPGKAQPHPAMPHRIFQSSKWVKTQGKRLTTGEDLTAFHLKLELKTERILIKLSLAVAIGTHYLGLQPHLHTGEQVRRGECSDGKTATEIKLLKEVSLVIGDDVSTTLAPSQGPSLI